jgi:hypothetical protein
MTSKTKKWTKIELQIYILLMCANADKNETDDELNMIKSKVDLVTFNKIYKEFINDTDEVSLQKVDSGVHEHSYSNMELIDFRREVYEIFFSDCKFTMMEKRLDWTLDNILY